MKWFKLLFALIAVDAGEIEVDSAPLSKQETYQYRKVRFEQQTNQMKAKVSETFECHSLFNQEQEMALWECTDTSTGRKFGALFVWQNEAWAKTPGILTD